MYTISLCFHAFIQRDTEATLQNSLIIKLNSNWKIYSEYYGWNTCTWQRKYSCLTWNWESDSSFLQINRPISSICIEVWYWVPLSCAWCWVGDWYIYGFITWEKSVVNVRAQSFINSLYYSSYILPFSLVLEACAYSYFTKKHDRCARCSCSIPYWNWTIHHQGRLIRNSKWSL